MKKFKRRYITPPSNQDGTLLNENLKRGSVFVHNATEVPMLLLMGSGTPSFSPPIYDDIISPGEKWYMEETVYTGVIRYRLLNAITGHVAISEGEHA